MAHLANQEMRLITVGLGFFGAVGWSDLKGEKWRGGKDKKNKHRLFKERNVMYHKTTII